MSEISFTVPGAPQGKGRPRVGRIAGQARMFTPAKTAAYEGLIAHAAAQAMAGRAPLDEPVVLTIHAAVPVPASWSKRKQAQALAGEIRPTGKPDLDNVLKAVCDGCNGVLWRDDAVVVAVTARKAYAQTPGVLVQAHTVAELEAMQ